MYLNCHSFHSLRYGTIPLQELVQQAAVCNVKAMALTDINTANAIATATFTLPVPVTRGDVFAVLFEWVREANRRLDEGEQMGPPGGDR